MWSGCVCVGGKLEHEKMKKHQRFLGTISIEDEEKEKTKKKEEAYRRRLENRKKNILVNVVQY